MNLNCESTFDKQVLPPNLQEYIAIEIKNQVNQFKAEMTQYMNENSKGFNEKYLRNRENIDSLKENVFKQNVFYETLSNKVEDYNSELFNMANILQIELEKLKKDPVNNNSNTLDEKQIEANYREYTDSKCKILENQQKEIINQISKVKDDLNKNVNYALNDIAHKISYDNEVKLKAIGQEILESWENKLNKIVDSFNYKIINVEKQLLNNNSIPKIDESAILDQSHKYTEAKISDINQNLRDQIIILKKMIESKVDETTFKSHVLLSKLIFT